MEKKRIWNQNEGLEKKALDVDRDKCQRMERKLKKFCGYIQIMLMESTYGILKVGAVDLLKELGRHAWEVQLC
jgi:hypothetical protein